MTRLEYVRQFPGLEDETYNTLDCPREYGLDCDDCGTGCKDCFDKEAMIGGKPAPYMFACPVKPGQTVYSIHWDPITTLPDVRAEKVYQVVFVYEQGWRADVGGIGSIDKYRWMKTVFPTNEGAEAAIENMED